MSVWYGESQGYSAACRRTALAAAARTDSVGDIGPAGSVPAKAAMDQHFLSCLPGIHQKAARQPAFFHPRLELFAQC